MASSSATSFMSEVDWSSNEQIEKDRGDFVRIFEQ